MTLKMCAFGLLGNLCTLTGGNYETAQPFLKIINHVNASHEMGNRIIILTMRCARNKWGVYHFTIQQLRLWVLKFNEPVTGKAHFDILVDDKAFSEMQYFIEVGLND